MAVPSVETTADRKAVRSAGRSGDLMVDEKDETKDDLMAAERVDKMAAKRAGDLAV